MQSFTHSGIPMVFALLAIAAEFLGPVGLAAGLLTRVAAFGILCDMLVIIARGQWRYGFFMNWSGRQPGEGFEFHLLVVGIAIAIILPGAGTWGTPPFDNSPSLAIIKTYAKENHHRKIGRAVAKAVPRA